MSVKFNGRWHEPSLLINVESLILKEIEFLLNKAQRSKLHTGFLEVIPRTIHRTESQVAASVMIRKLKIWELLLAFLCIDHTTIPFRAGIWRKTILNTLVPRYTLLPIMIQDNRKEPVSATHHPGNLLRLYSSLLGKQKTHHRKATAYSMMKLVSKNIACLPHLIVCTRHRRACCFLLQQVQSIMMSSVCYISVQCPGMVRSSRDFSKNKLQHPSGNRSYISQN